MELEELSYQEILCVMDQLMIDGLLEKATTQEEVEKLKSWQRAVKKQWRFARLVREKGYYDNTPGPETPAFFRGVNKIEWENRLKQRMGLQDPEHLKLMNDMLIDFNDRKKAEEGIKMEEISNSDETSKVI